jgi:hypothetical protein
MFKLKLNNYNSAIPVLAGIILITLGLTCKVDANEIENKENELRFHEYESNKIPGRVAISDGISSM